MESVKRESTRLKQMYDRIIIRVKFIFIHLPTPYVVRTWYKKSPDFEGRGSHEKNGKIAFGQ